MVRRRPDRGRRRAELIEAVAADRDDVLLGRGQFRAERGTGREAAAGAWIADVGTGCPQRQIIAQTRPGQRVVDDQRIVGDQLADLIAGEERIDRRRLRGIDGEFISRGVTRR